MKILERRFLKTTTRSVHAATIAFFNDHPVFAWFGGWKEGNPDVSIYINNLHGKDETIILGAKDYMPHWNPVLLSVNNSIYLFEKAGTFCDSWQTFFHDLGNWSIDPTEKEIKYNRQILSAGLNGPVKTKPIIVDNKLLCGSSVETIYDWVSYIEEYDYPKDNSYNINKAFISRSKPLFVPEKVIYRDFQSGVVKTSLGIIQPTLWNDGKQTHALFRSSKGLGKIYYSLMLKNGQWTDPIKTNLDNPNSAIDCVYINNKLYIVYNPNEHYRLPLIISEIEYENFDPTEIKCKNNIVIGDKLEENTFLTEELSYPYMIEYAGKLYLVYTVGRSRIELVVVEP